MDDARPPHPPLRPEASRFAFGLGPAFAMRALREPVVAPWWIVVPLVLGSLLVSLTRRARAPIPRAGPADRGAWLHVVSGANPARVTEAVLTVASGLLEPGGRVLVVEAGDRLQLHRRFDLESRWGVGECLDDSMPVLGVVQHTGHAGLYLLARGAIARSADWSQLGRLLDQARPHFTRAVVGLDSGAPRELDEALRNLAPEGWWAGSGRLPRAAVTLSDKLGIPLIPMSLPGGLKAALERLPAGLEEPLPQPGTATPPDPAQVSMEVPAKGGATPWPVVLDCDLRVRERLRFLAWVRRTREEASHMATSSPPALPPTRRRPSSNEVEWIHA